ncbi:hypothetical protein QNO00_06530 [Arthrobacter sp. zg-Y1219]|uniref:hypothetical protein n=1 Tax=Arthrobacter sp. zg-Y1219 TaxID=3049067 RepID=UPI0024C236C3|nr:hypothetical protein [Arthrobacter sp. zg-Y1219]MDK1359922.1 hypothetical protein [Arthrobacter sp. zg-Y1219]
MKTLHFPFITSTGTYSWVRLILRATAVAALVIAGIWPGSLLSWLVVLMLLREVLRVVISFLACRHDTKSFVFKLKEQFPGTPAVTAKDFKHLVRTGHLAVDCGAGSWLFLSLSEGVPLRGLKSGYKVTGRNRHGDFGLAEFDAIMDSLVFSAPVAAALKAVKSEERKIPPAPPGPRLPGSPREPQPKTFNKKLAIASGLWHGLFGSDKWDERLTANG